VQTHSRVVDWRNSDVKNIRISVEAHGIKIMNAIDVAQRFFV